MSNKQELPLLGYVDRLSARPGDTLEFKVSSTSEQDVQARLYRSISADPNPEGAGIVEQDASAFMPAVSFASVRRAFHAGSYGVAVEAVRASALSSLTFAATIFPTLRAGRVQSILSVGQFDLQLDTVGRLCLRVGAQAYCAEEPLKLRRWCQVEVQVLSKQIIFKQDEKEVAALLVEGEIPLDLLGKPVVAARRLDEQFDQHFNGKIEAPAILLDGSPFCIWDFSVGISSTKASALAGPDLQLINFPARAVTGSLWDGTEMNWTHQSSHYAAIHFHEDDLYDVGWDTDLQFSIPADMPSGVYILRLSCDGHEDAIPFFVCAPLGRPAADYCVLMSTFTYSIYGNHARPDYDPSWQQRIDDWKAYPYNPANHPEYGLSTYNYHSDGSGISHACHRRPLFNLKPGYITFGKSACSGLRHFPADMHLISWLHAKGIDYDIVTDDELHRDGVAAIEGYKTLTTGSHPEYHTLETLNALTDFRDGGGHLHYLGGNGFYWRVARHPEHQDVLEIRRAEDGIRAWAAEPGEYYNAFDGCYGGLWRRNGRAPQQLIGVGFTAQGEFFGDPYRRVCEEASYDWVFAGIDDELLGNFGFSGNGAAGFELDHIDYRLGTPDNTVHLARSVTRESGFMLVPEEQLTHLTNLTGGTAQEALHADMVYIEYTGGGCVFSAGSITFCGCLPWNNFDNNISQLLENVVRRSLLSDD